MVFNVRLKSTGEIIFQSMDIPTMRTISMSTYISCGILCPDDLTGELVGNLNHPYERTIEFDITIRNSILRSCMKISNAVNNITVENSSLTLLLYRQKSLTIHSIGDNHLKFREAVWTGIATPNHWSITFYITRGGLQSLLLSENNNCKLQVGKTIISTDRNWMAIQLVPRSSIVGFFDYSSWLIRMANRRRSIFIDKKHYHVTRVNSFTKFRKLLKIFNWPSHRYHRWIIFSEC